MSHGGATADIYTKRKPILDEEPLIPAKRPKREGGVQAKKPLDYLTKEREKDGMVHLKMQALKDDTEYLSKVVEEDEEKMLDEQDEMNL